MESAADSGKSAIRQAEGAVQKQVNGIQQELDDVKQSLNQGVSQLTIIASRSIAGVQDSVHDYVDTVSQCLYAVRSDLSETSTMIRDQLTDNIAFAQDQAIRTAEQERVTITRTLDDALAKVLLGTDKIHHELTTAWKDVSNKTLSVEQWTFDELVGHLTATFAMINYKLDEIHAYLTTKIDLAFAQMGELLVSLHGKASKLLNKTFHNLRVPESAVKLSVLMNNYVCEPLQALLLAKINVSQGMYEEWTASFNRATAGPSSASSAPPAKTTATMLPSVSQEEQPPPASVSRRLAVASPSLPRLVDVLRDWWHEDQARCKTLAALTMQRCSPAERHALVLAELSALRQELRGELVAAAHAHLLAAPRVGLGITMQGKSLRRRGVRTAQTKMRLGSVVRDRETLPLEL